MELDHQAIQQIIGTILLILAVPMSYYIGSRNGGEREQSKGIRIVNKIAAALKK